MSMESFGEKSHRIYRFSANRGGEKVRDSASFLKGDSASAIHGGILLWLVPRGSHNAVCHEMDVR